MGWFTRQAAPAGGSQPRLSALSDAELKYVADHLGALGHFSTDLSDAASVEKLYNTLLEQWTQMPDDTKPDANSMVNLIGTAFGELLVRRALMTWVIASDEMGDELAVHHTAGDLLIYPANAVAKRWVEASPGDFIPATLDRAIELVRA